MQGDFPILLFDGECGLCQGSIRFILARERGDRLRFAAFDSQAGKDLCAQHGIIREAVKSMVLIRGRDVLIRSDAVLAVAGELRFPWSLAGAFRIIPRVLRDSVYGFVSRNRYRWSRAPGACLLPESEAKGRFLG